MRPWSSASAGASTLATAAFFLFASSCGIHYSTPRRQSHDARFGFVRGGGAGLNTSEVCRHWRGTIGRIDRYANVHVSYPESAPELSCYTPVTYTAHNVQIGTVPHGCEYPQQDQIERLQLLADRLEQRDSVVRELFPCAMTDANCASAIRHDVTVLRATAERVQAASATKYPYSAVIAFGYGWHDQAQTSIADWRPGDACHALSQSDIDRMGVMNLRTRRVADALRAGVAPMAIVSGGTQHSRMVEAFAMLFLLRCAFGVPADRVLLEPCAEHTHTNVRNSGRWLVEMGSRAGYIVTDDGLQKQYLEEYSGFDLLFGSIDARSLRDWGYLLGSWRRAAEGPNVGYWYTPYRFWAEPRPGLGTLSCLDVAASP